MLERLTYYLQAYAFEPSMVIQNAVTSLSVLMILERRSENHREPWRQRAVSAVVLFAALVILNGVWEMLFQRQGSYFVTHPLLLVGYALWLRQLKKKSCQITLLLFYAAEMCLILLSATFPNALADVAYGSTIEIFLRNACVLLILPVALWFRRYSIQQFQDIPMVSLHYAYIISAASIALALLYNRIRSDFTFTSNVFALSAFGCILVLNMVAYYLDYAVCQHSEAERRLMAEKYIAQSERNLMELSRQNLDELRAIRHDIKNQYAYMDALLTEKRYDELQEFFDQNKQANSKPLSGIDCGNLVLNTILNLEQGRAHAQGCVLDHRIFVAPQLPFAETDLCSLLTNLIDNALEAIQRQNIANGVVEVGINQKNSALYLCVLNPVDEQLGRETLLSLKTTKKDKTMHGYGVRIVDSIVQKYNGQISRSIENGKYRVDIMLDLRWAENVS